MSEILEKYAEASAEELMEAISASEDKKEKAELMSLMRSRIRHDEKRLRDDLKKAAEDSKEEKRLLKKTQVSLIDVRKEYLESYRDMNAIINGKSMLKHLGDFSEKVKAFKEKSAEFEQALTHHLENLAVVKRKTSDNG